MKKQSLIENGHCPIDTTRRDRAEAAAAPMQSAIDNRKPHNPRVPTGRPRRKK